jgi:hypothetical protein
VTGEQRFCDFLLAFGARKAVIPVQMGRTCHHAPDRAGELTRPAPRDP